MRDLGLDTMFTLVGDHLNDVLREAALAEIRIIDMRHESGVTHAADAHARITRKPALSLVTGGPGHTNSLTGIATAFLNASPVIAVSGSRATSVADRGAFQDIRQVEMAAPVVKWAAETPSAGQIPFYLAKAYREASAGRQGPVHLTIPTDLFSGNAAAAEDARLPAASVPGPDAGAVANAVALLREAKHPVVIAGSGIWWAHAETELLRFLEHTGLPVYTATLAKGAVPDAHPQCFGYPDPALNQAARRAFAEADVFLILGKRIDYRLALGSSKLIPADAKVIQIDIEPRELGLNRKLEVGICADLRSTLQHMLRAAGVAAWTPLPWLATLRQYRAEWEEELLRRSQLPTAGLIHPAAFFFALRKHLNPASAISWDGGDFVQWGRAVMPASGPKQWLRLGPLGTIGAGLPNAIGMAVANPGVRHVMITGDGSLGFYIAELDSLVRHKIPLIIIVGNDAGWGLERELQGVTDTVACELLPTRYDRIMEGFGGAGETVTSVDQLESAMARAYQSDVPYLLNVRIAGRPSPFTEWQLAGKKK